MAGIWPGCPLSMCTWPIMPAYVCEVSPHTCGASCAPCMGGMDYSEIISYMS